MYNGSICDLKWVFAFEHMIESVSTYNVSVWPLCLQNRNKIMRTVDTATSIAPARDVASTAAAQVGKFAESIIWRTQC